jgi:hypothetical protein
VEEKEGEREGEGRRKVKGERLSGLERVERRE